MIKKYAIVKTVEAVQFNGNNYEECKQFLEGKYDNTLNYPNIIAAGGSALPVNINDYIIKGMTGSFFLKSATDFHALYKEVKN